MLTAEECYKIASKELKVNKVRGCKDLGKFYIFSLAPINISDDDDYVTGTTFDAVDKQTGRLFIFDVMSNISLFEKGKSVKIKGILDTPISEIKGE